MKREILCPPCSQIVLGRMAAYPGEGHKSVHGKSKRSLRCDKCNDAIPIGAKCHAISMYSDRLPYFEWEWEYLEMEGKR